MKELKEVAERRKHFEAAIRSVEMEGFEFTDEELAVFERIIQGEITTEDAINDIKNHASELKKARPELFVEEGD